MLVNAAEDVAVEEGSSSTAVPPTPVEDAYQAPADAQSFAFEAEVSRMLDIVINSLYQNKDIFLRELISNASDALDKVRFLALTKPDYLAVESKLQVQIEFDKAANTLTVRDTGIGMTMEDMISNLGTVARSGTTRFMQALKDSGDASSSSGMISQIGQFGVGFYSSFLVADRVQVASKHPDSPDQYVWTSTNGANDFQVFKDPRGNTLTRGTEITLFLKDDAMEYASQEKLEQMAKHYSEFVVHPIYLQTFETMTVEIEDEEGEDATSSDEKEEPKDDLEVSDEEDEDKDTAKEKPKKTKEVTTMEWEHLNKSPAIWTRPKDEITDDEYKSFFKVVTHDEYQEPERWTHFLAEGNINFKSILYLPKDVPEGWKAGNLDSEKRGLSLYVQKVLISDAFELLPRYLSFMRGVIDSDDLPLNVNRETLQESKIIQVIKKKVVRKALELLKTFAKESDEAAAPSDETTTEDDETPGPKPNAYNDWYANFAPSLKLGAIEDEPNRSKILKLLRFKTTKASGATEYRSLDQYVEDMKDWQKEIFFLAGVDKASIEKSQFLEQFLAKDVEVIYFVDPMDEYMAQSIRSFDGKRLKNIATDSVQLKDETDEDLATRREKYYKNKFQPLTKWLKKLYGVSIMRVAVSNRLVSAPAITSSAEFGHSANMERIMRAQAYSHGQHDFAMRSMKILELNPRHPLVLKLLDGAPPEDAGDDFTVDPDVEDAAWILHEVALLNGGFPLSDAEAHTKRMLRFMQSQLGVESTELAPEPDLSLVEEVPPEVNDFDPDDFPFTGDEDGILDYEL
jgi:heat shock protein 90kDa beta